MRDLLRLVMPGFIELMTDFDFVVGDFGDYEEREPSPEVEARPVRELMETAVSVTADSGLLRAFALIVNHNLTDLPVVDQDGLFGRHRFARRHWRGFAGALERFNFPYLIHPTFPL